MAMVNQVITWSLFVQTKSLLLMPELVYEPGTLTGTSQRDKLP